MFYNLVWTHNADLPGVGRDELVIGAHGVLNGFGPAKFDGAC
jgi:hypothetical protein